MLAESKNMTVIDILKFLDYIPANIHKMNEIVEKTYRKTRSNLKLVFIELVLVLEIWKGFQKFFPAINCFF